MIKINLKESNLTLVECLNFCMDVATWNRRVPIWFEFQGIEFVVTAVTDTGMAPNIKLLELSDWCDDYLSNEVIRRCVDNNNFALLLMGKINRHCQISSIFDCAESRN